MCVDFYVAKEGGTIDELENVVRGYVAIANARGGAYQAYMMCIVDVMDIVALGKPID